MSLIDSKVILLVFLASFSGRLPMVTADCNCLKPCQLNQTVCANSTDMQTQCPKLPLPISARKDCNGGTNSSCKPFPTGMMTVNMCYAPETCNNKSNINTCAETQCFDGNQRCSSTSFDGSTKFTFVCSENTTYIVGLKDSESPPANCTFTADELNKNYGNYCYRKVDCTNPLIGSRGICYCPSSTKRPPATSVTTGTNGTSGVPGTGFG